MICNDGAVKGAGQPDGAGRSDDGSVGVVGVSIIQMSSPQPHVCFLPTGALCRTLYSRRPVKFKYLIRLIMVVTEKELRSRAIKSGFRVLSPPPCVCHMHFSTFWSLGLRSAWLLSPQHLGHRVGVFWVQGLPVPMTRFGWRILNIKGPLLSILMQLVIRSFGTSRYGAIFCSRG